MDNIVDIPMIDLIDIQCVEVLVDKTHKLWINVGGKCLLRIGHVSEVKIDLPKLKHRF